VFPVRLALALALVGASPFALAQASKPATPAPAAKPAPAKPAETKAPPAPVKPAAAELARILMPKKTWAEGLDQLGQMVQMRLQAHPGSQSSLEYPKDLPAKIKTELEGVLPYEELVSLHARELSAAYTDAELGELLAFYKSPTGQKSLAKMGEVQNKVGLETQSRMEAKMPDIMQRLSSLAKVTPPKEGAKKNGTAGPKPAGHP
jgi:hypothetical protein